MGSALIRVRKLLSVARLRMRVNPSQWVEQGIGEGLGGDGAHFCPGMGNHRTDGDEFGLHGDSSSPVVASRRHYGKGRYLLGLGCIRKDNKTE